MLCYGDAVIKLFADDVKMYCPSNDVNIYSGLSLALSNAYWRASICQQLRISISKCAVLHLGSKNPKRSYMNTLNDDKIETVESFRDLGVLMSNNLKMSAYCTNIFSRDL